MVSNVNRKWRQDVASWGLGSCCPNSVTHNNTQLCISVVFLSGQSQGARWRVPKPRHTKCVHHWLISMLIHSEPTLNTQQTFDCLWDRNFSWNMAVTRDNRTGGGVTLGSRNHWICVASISRQDGIAPRLFLTVGEEQEEATVKEWRQQTIDRIAQ